MTDVNVQKMDAAYSAGQKVSKNLSAYTSRGAQREVIDLIGKNVDSKTVKTFLTGFKNPPIYTGPRILTPIAVTTVGKLGQKALGRDQFFDQIMTEYSFPEKCTGRSPSDRIPAP